MLPSFSVQYVPQTIGRIATTNKMAGAQMLQSTLCCVREALNGKEQLAS
jgi:hypothetical protein